jgi:hypothetical protein
VQKNSHEGDNKYEQNRDQMGNRKASKKRYKRLAMRDVNIRMSRIVFRRVIIKLAIRANMNYEGDHKDEQNCDQKDNHEVSKKRYRRLALRDVNKRMSRIMFNRVVMFEGKPATQVYDIFLNC